MQVLELEKVVVEFVSVQCRKRLDSVVVLMVV